MAGSWGQEIKYHLLGFEIFWVADSFFLFHSLGIYHASERYGEGNPRHHLLTMALKKGSQNALATSGTRIISRGVDVVDHVAEACILKPEAISNNSVIHGLLEQIMVKTDNNVVEIMVTSKDWSRCSSSTPYIPFRLRACSSSTISATTPIPSTIGRTIDVAVI